MIDMNVTGGKLIENKVIEKLIGMNVIGDMIGARWQTA